MFSYYRLVNSRTTKLSSNIKYVLTPPCRRQMAAARPIFKRSSAAEMVEKSAKQRDFNGKINETSTILNKFIDKFTVVSYTYLPAVVKRENKLSLKLILVPNLPNASERRCFFKLQNELREANYTPQKLSKQKLQKQTKLGLKISKLKKDTKNKPKNSANKPPNVADIEKELKNLSTKKLALQLNLVEDRWRTKLERVRPFLNVCSAISATDRLFAETATNVLEEFVKNCGDTSILQKNVDIFTTVLSACRNLSAAESAEFAERIVRLMRQKIIKPDLRTISAYLLTAVDKNSGKIYKDRVKKVVKFAEENKLNLENILQSRVHGLKETREILSAIRTINKNFTPSKFSINTSYSDDCKLLNYTKIPLEKNEYLDDGPYAKIWEKSSEKLRENFDRQLRYELENRVEFPALSTIENENNNLTMEKTKVKTLEEWKRMWKNCLEKNFDQILNELKSKSFNEENSNTKFSSTNNDVYYLPFLNCVERKTIVDLMLDFVVYFGTFPEQYSEPVHVIKRKLGRNVYNCYSTKIQLENEMQTKIRRIYDVYSRYFDDSEATRKFNQREFWYRAASELYPENPHVKIYVPYWPQEVLTRLGDILFDVILKSIWLPTPENPAFYKVTCGSGKLSHEELRVQNKFARLMQKNNQTLTMSAQMCPMICPPVPWQSFRKGYFSFQEVTLVRTPGEFAKYSKKLEESIRKHKENNYQKLFPALDALNQLGSLPWKINGKVLDVAVEIFRTGKGDEQLKIPADSRQWRFERPAKQADETKLEYRKRKMAFYKTKSETYSLWCTALYRLSLASHYRDDVLWFPHSLDFRGRAYPVPPHLNHMGDDLCRGILCFAKGRKLGKDGLKWLKLQCVNLTELKKRESYAERLRFAEEIRDEIIDSADNPLTGRGWWRQSENPWETLACCIEIANAERCPEGPENYVCHFPIHQDGCCNGLQHYAALGRDEKGAEQVNMINRDKPHDVYSTVADLVEKRRQADADASSKSKNAQIARICDGYVKRQTIKRTVMTICYGVTEYGAKLQIEKELKEFPSFDRSYMKQASSYLAKLTFDSIGELFNNSRKIQKWFDKCAKLMSNQFNQPVQWLTPLGLPILQPYFVRKPLKNVKPLTSSGDHVTYPNVDVPLANKQRQAFPPNFIHSLDSTHMMLTALSCQRRGITYAMVHDCFWTHPDTVDEMNKVCRSEFVRLYNEPILEYLSSNFHQILQQCLNENDRFESVTTRTVGEKTQVEESSVCTIPLNDVLKDEELSPDAKEYALKILHEIPVQGNFDLNLVANAPFFFS